MDLVEIPSTPLHAGKESSTQNQRVWFEWF